MIQFDRLTLSGFKSFVDKTDLDIAPGLTGIVGPNGCGKSNLVEALRWAMGESSARRLRGGDMDDVIFNGTSSRPARNFAEVVLHLNNGMHTAPDPYAAFDQIEISRRIERENGSTYRINGKIARARDVQMLLADTMTGAHSPALVSQGKLTQIISAKPFDRRMILEESAGISGLHARRHEAELRLQAADNNLARLQDSVGALDTQLASLKRQSRQAEKYRTMTEEIKQLETTIAAMDWVKLSRQKQLALHDVTSIETTVADALLAVTQLTQTLDARTADLPALRNAAAECAARVQAVTIELKQLEVQARQIDDAMHEAERLIAEAASDIAHDEQLINDSRALLAALETEEQQLIAEGTGQEDRLPALEQTRDTLTVQLEKLESELQEKTRTLIEHQAQRTALAQQITQNEHRLVQGRARADDIRKQLEDVEESTDFTATCLIEDQIKAAEMKIDTWQTDAPDYMAAIDTAERILAEARAVHDAARDHVTKLLAEKKPLEDFLAADLSTAHPILDDIKADAGFETALAKALGDTLFGSTDEQAAMVWRGREGLTPPAFPSTVAPMDERVKAPDALHGALGYIGYVATRADGDAAAADLKPGQTIVSIDGYLWRWDGLFVKPTSKDRQAIILEQKNRLTDITAKLPQAQADLATAEKAFTAAEEQMTAARVNKSRHDQDVRDTQTALNTLRIQLQKKLQDEQNQENERTRLTEQLNFIGQENAERAREITAQKDELSRLPDPDESNLQGDVAALREQTATLQGDLRTATLAVDRFVQDQSRRQARLHGIADQRIATQNRTSRAAEHLAALSTRKQQAEEKCAALAAQPNTVRAQRDALMSRLSELEKSHSQADAALQHVENDVGATTRDLRAAESALSTAKETRAGLIERLSGFTERLTLMESEMMGMFGVSPQDLLVQSNVSFDMSDTDLAESETKRARKEKLMRDRDAMGPVNLRADVEAQEIESTLGKILTERTDLIAAIEELRAGIAKINAEAKERLATAFETINSHFKDLFTRLFGGGQAYLQMIEMDGDPLAAGLEIYAQPPGKSLQSISLLSGGEQSLTAAALIFAMFLTNPSPICVLDEIDAPLDDANVDRICHLLRHITDTCQTRFLVVTHHRLTMAKMDRLYGVTMGEKGVSQLVSVDLSQQMDLLDAA